MIVMGSACGGTRYGQGWQGLHHRRTRSHTENIFHGLSYVTQRPPVERLRFSAARSNRLLDRCLSEARKETGPAENCGNLHRTYPHSIYDAIRGLNHFANLRIIAFGHLATRSRKRLKSLNRLHDRPTTNSATRGESSAMYARMASISRSA